MREPPNDPTISGPEGSWLKRLKDFGRQNRLLPGQGYKIKETASGIILEIDRGPSAAPASTGSLCHAVFAPGHDNPGIGTGGDVGTGGDTLTGGSDVPPKIPSRIYGIRGGTIFEFSSGGAFTGRKLTFADGFPLDSYLAWDPDSNKLWASYWGDIQTGERVSERGLYRFDLDKFVVDRFFRWSMLGIESTDYYTNNNTAPDGVDETFAYGPRRITIANGIIYGAAHAFGEFNIFSSQLFLQGVDKQSNLISSSDGWALDFGAVGWNAAYFDRDNNQFWFGNDTGLIRIYRPDGDPNWADFRNDYYYAYVFSELDGGGSTQSKANGGIYGVDYCPLNGLLYCVGIRRNAPEVPSGLGHAQIAVLDRNIDHTAGFTQFPIDPYDLDIIERADGVPLIDAVASKPRNIRWSDKTKKFYLPTGKANTVIELDPSGGTDVISKVFTGLDQPWDILTTDKNVFAVQLGSQGLKKLV